MEREPWKMRLQLMARCWVLAHLNGLLQCSKRERQIILFTVIKRVEREEELWAIMDASELATSQLSKWIFDLQVALLSQQLKSNTLFSPPPRNFSITLSLDLRALVWNEYKTSFQQFTYNNSMAAGACEHIQLEAWTQAVSKQRHARHCTPHTDPEGTASARHHNKEVFITRPNYNRLLAPIHFADRQEKSKVLRINSILTFSITLFSSLYLSFRTCTGSVVHFFPY